MSEAEPGTELEVQHYLIQELRKRTLNMFSHGVLGSEVSVPISDDPKAVKLPRLLRYSSTTLHHFQALHRILVAPRDFHIVSEVGELPDDESEGGDVLYSNNRGELSYKFIHELTSPYLDSFMASFDRIGGRLETLKISFWKSFRLKPWFLRYNYHIPQRAKVVDPGWERKYNQECAASFGMSYPVYLERFFLLTFTYSLCPLSKNWFVNIFSDKAISQNLSHVETKTVGQFRVLTYKLDVASALEQYRALYSSSSNPQLYKPIISGLEERREVEFHIVQLGYFEIEGKKWYVYTGAEKPPLKEFAGEPDKAGVLKGLVPALRGVRA